MSKLYIFGIGGTGSRVLKSLTMLLASGVKCDVDTIVPIIIDRDKGNGDYSRTDGLIKNYIAVNKIAPKNDKKKKIKNHFFNTEIKLLRDELLLKLDDEANKFEDFIGISSQTYENKALSQMLFSENTLMMDTEHGFKGNPNIGSVVLNQFDDKNIFKAFASDFQDGDKIFIISSIFGGTGASGFPLLRKILQTPNVKDANGAELPNWGLINAAPIGAISVLPYFNVDKKGNVDSDTFNDKTRAALSYYETENGKIDTLYYIADTNRKAYKYAEGGKEQENDAHFVELAAAMSILDFINEDKKLVNFQKNGAGKRKTTYKEFGINSDVTEISFDNLTAETQKLIVNPLSRFMMFAKYMGFTIVKKTEEGNDKYVAARVPQYDIFNKENKYQPYTHSRFTGSFRNNIADLETIMTAFLNWLQQMKQQSRKFSPFNLTATDAFNFVNGNISLFIKKDFRYKNWAKVDNELNKQITKTNSSLAVESQFIELFYRATEELINQSTQNSGDGDKYIFRLQNDGNFGLVNTIEHWGVSDMYGEKQRNAIKSSNDKSENQPTSIPSPFARIALVKTAFSEVAEYGAKALAAYQKIVSDTLDVAEIFFTFDKWKVKKDGVEIITWDRTKDLPELSKVKTQKILHKTFETFLTNDAEIYNFDKMKCMYILKHKKTGEMIGATSPCTLFFSSANDLSEIDIQLTTHKAFDGIVPLHKRGWGFQKYLYTWLNANNEVRESTGKCFFDEVQSYLDVQKQISIDNGKNATNFDITDFEKDESGNVKNYKQLRSPDVEILGKNYYELDVNSETEDNQATVKGTLGKDDLLEDKIIRLPYAIRKDSFFDGNLPNDCEYTYLLPIKEEFFKHWKVKDLKGAIKIGHYTQYAKVTLTIAGKTYEKEYKVSDENIIQPPDFDCAIFPNVRFVEDKDAHYRFGLVYNFKEKEKYSAEFVKIGVTIDASKKRESVRNETYNGNIDKQLKNYSLEGSNFDYIKISYEGINGIVVPILELKNGNKEFTFAVDFGTTNTHIEYKYGNDKEQKFDILENSKDKKNECQVHWLHGVEATLRYVFDEEFIPAYTDGEFKFPMRSALSFGEKTNWSNVYPFEKASPAALYEKRFESPYNEITTDLKWSDNADNKNQVKAYIESLMFLLRNKVIIGNGDLSKTKIRWFWPVAMERDRYNTFETVWNNAYKKYFSDNEINIVPITESVAPFEYYVRDGNSSNLITVDIGGGTTDIVIANGSNNADFITSFRFAANSIFGDGYSETGRVKNGLIMQFANTIKEELLTEINENDDLFRIFKDMMDNKNSSDIASFLFSIGNNKKVIDAGKNLSENANLSKKLKEEPKSQEITFIFFYSAIIYHLAKLMKAKDLQMPDKIVFSGNGSRVISLFTNDKKLLADYTKLIFTKIYDANKYHENGLEIILNEKEPKEATCKGGFYVTKSESYGDIFKKKIVLHSNGTNTVIQRNDENLNSSPKESDKNKSVNDDYINKTVEEAKTFIQFVFDLLPFFSNNGYKLNPDSVNVAKDTCFKKLDIYVKNGWELKKQKEKISDEDVIEETLFFYPLVGMLKELGDAICNKNLSNTK